MNIEATEVWKDIAGFGPVYQVSNLGRVRSLDHWFYSKLIGKDVFRRGRIIAQTFTTFGYKQITIKKGQNKKTIAVHKLVYETFVGRYDSVRFQIDHIDNDKLNNSLDNLQILTCRENSAKRSKALKKTSAYTGVSWCRYKQKWMSQIKINSKSKYLGRYDIEEDAARAYQAARAKVA
jgi:hypothetical protein